MADKQYGVWRRGNRYALPTSPHPRRRLLELSNSCATLTRPTAQKIGHSNYNVVAFGKQGYFAKQLQAGTRIKLVVQAQSQPENIASIPLLTATFVRPVNPVAVAPSTGVWHTQRAFQDAVALGFDDFTFLLKGKPLNMDKVDAVRLELAIRYRTRAWQTIDVDLGPSGKGAVNL